MYQQEAQHMRSGWSDPFCSLVGSPPLDGIYTRWYGYLSVGQLYYRLVSRSAAFSLRRFSHSDDHKAAQKKCGDQAGSRRPLSRARASSRIRTSRRRGEHRRAGKGRSSRRIDESSSQRDRPRRVDGRGTAFFRGTPAR